jgi:cyclase
MFRPRIIPVLLLKGNALVKSKRFKDFRYIGDPINAVKVFNDLKADELVFLDIEATKEKRIISTELIKQVGEEANMPFAVGGGIKNLDEIQNIIAKGAEKVIINTCAVENPKFIREASDNFGSSTIAVCIDVRKKIFSGEVVWSNSGLKSSKYSPKDFAKIIEDNGAGEIIIQSIYKDGTMSGYDLDLIKEISTTVTIPVVALGGAGNLEHMIEAYKKGFASALAAGSLFVFQGPDKGVLINYVEKSDLSFF